MLALYFCATHRCRSRHIFGGKKDFCPNSPKLAEKTWPPKKSLHVNWGTIFFNSKQAGRHICSYIQGVYSDVLETLWRFSETLPKIPRILPRSSPKQNFWGCACTPALPLLHQWCHHPLSHFTTLLTRALFFGLFIYFCSTSGVSRSCYRWPDWSW